MILVDTSVWVAHLRHGERRLEKILADGAVLLHPFVAGELACGNLSHREDILADLARLPGAPLATIDEVLALIETHRLFGRGLGWIDVNLLASALLAGSALWTLDKVLRAAAPITGVALFPLAVH